METLPVELIEQIFTCLSTANRLALRGTTPWLRRLLTPALFTSCTLFTTEQNPHLDVLRGLREHMRTLRLDCCSSYPHRDTPNELFQIKHNCCSVAFTSSEPLSRLFECVHDRGRQPAEPFESAHAAFQYYLSHPAVLSAAKEATTELTLTGITTYCALDIADFTFPHLQTLKLRGLPDREVQSGSFTTGIGDLVAFIRTHFLSHRLQEVSVIGCREIDYNRLMRELGSALEIGAFFFRHRPLMLTQTTEGPRAAEFAVEFVDPREEVAQGRTFYGWNFTDFGMAWKRVSTTGRAGSETW